MKGFGVVSLAATGFEGVLGGVTGSEIVVLVSEAGIGIGAI